MSVSSTSRPWEIRNARPSTPGGGQLPPRRVRDLRNSGARARSGVHFANRPPTPQLNPTPQLTRRAAAERAQEQTMYYSFPLASAALRQMRKSMVTYEPGSLSPDRPR